MLINLINAKNIIMKTLINKLLLLFFAAGIIQSCKTDDMNYSEATVTPVKSLYEPANNKSVKLLNSASASLYFEWEPVRVEDGGAASYEVLFDKPGGDFSNPVYTVASGNRGYSNGVSIEHKVLNKIAVLAGFEPGSTGELIWTVAASRGINRQVAAEKRSLTITSLEGFADVPDEVFITGEGSEGGTTLANALPMKLTAPGEFEIYTKLEAGKSYWFADRKSGTPRVFYSADGATLRESDEDAAITATKTGIYKIQLDFTVATISFTEIKSMGLFFCPDNKVIWNLTYQGNGVWTGTGIVNFKQESWGRDERYKFQMETESNGTAATVQIGTLNSTDSPPNASSDPSYYYVRILPSVSQWDDKWKFMSSVDGKSPTVSVIMKGDSEYTHTVTVN